MLVDSPFVGDWMASTYSIGGKRSDIRLFLDPDGNYERSVRSEPENEPRIDRGKWHHKEGDDVLCLESLSEGNQGHTEDWWVLSVKTCEDSNCLMVLRWAGLASRNLPMLFYRVHLTGR
jgi:hypothetical protein